jgi:methionyl-tRNA formyltransferase
MNKLKIGYFADGPWSHKAFERIINDINIQILFIVPRNDSKDKTLKNFSEKHKIDYIYPADINSKEFFEKVKQYDCDLFVSMSFNQIFMDEIMNLPRFKTINCHAGKLPFYRGRNILNWALINDEKEFGITVHYIDSGIDTGDIIIQRCFPINDNDDYSTLLNTSYEECANILYDALSLFFEGNVKRIKQKSIHPSGFYCGKRTEGDEIINWHQTSREIFNFIRAICAPGPKATTYLGKQQIKINSSALIEEAINYKGKPGQVLYKTEVGYVVKTLDSTIEIKEIEGNYKLKIGEVLK